MVSSNIIPLRTQISTEELILKSILNNLKNFILNNDGRKFKEKGSSVGTGAAEASLEFSIAEEKYILAVTTKGKREITKNKTEKGFWLWKRTEKALNMFLEIQFTLQGNVPKELLKDERLKQINAKKTTNGIEWNHLIVKELNRNPEKEELSIQEMTQDFIFIIEAEKETIIDETKAILNDFFILINRDKERPALAAK